MNLADVMDQLAARLETIADLRVYPFPAGSVPPPAAIVSYPETYTFDGTGQRGVDLIEDLPVVLVVGAAHDRAARDAVADYTNGSGERSVKAVIESGAYTAFDVVRVTSVEFDSVRIGGTDYLAALFRLDIAGKGT